MRARATLALRRVRPFALRWSVAVGALVALAAFFALVGRSPAVTPTAIAEAVAIDTLRSGQRVRAAEAAVAAAESTLAVARTSPRATAGAPVVRVAPPLPSSPAPGLSVLAQRITAARAARSVSAYLDVATQPQVGDGPRMRALADSIRRLEARRVAASGAEADALDQAIGRVGRTIVAIADYRRAELEAQAGASATVPAATITPPVRPPVTLPGAAVATTQPTTGPDTLGARQALEEAQDALRQAQLAHDSLVAAARATGAVGADDRQERIGLTRLMPVFTLAFLLVAGLVLAFASALRRELDAPTLAGPAEAERLTGLRVLSVVREVPPQGPARFRPSGVDPFRMLYLGLTATGTRTRSALVSGADPEIAAAVGARLAIAAAADHRSTLIADLDVREIALSRTFRERSEPGVSDVLAGAFAWRDVARPVGSSDGLSITMLPAGTDREVPATIGERTLEEYARFRAPYELTIVLAPLDAVALAGVLDMSGPAVLTAVVGERSIDGLLADVAALRSTGRRIQGLVLWDVARPTLPSRAALAAELSKRKGRTPGGSFEAVERAIGRGIKSTNRP